MNCLRRLRGHIPAAWPVLLIAAPAMVAVWSGWVGLSKLTGFGVVHPLPGIWDALEVNTSITLSIGVEAYGAYAVKVALTAARRRTKLFAAASGFVSLVLGAYGQMQYHLLEQANATRAPEMVTRFVSVLPIVVVGLTAILWHLVQADAEAEREANEAAELARAEAERDAAVRTAEANAAAVADELKIEQERTRQAELAAERDRAKAERQAVREASGAAGAKAERAPRTTPNASSDLQRSRRSAADENPDAFAAWAAREGTERAMTTAELAVLLGVSKDAARTQANRWRRGSRSATAEAEAAR